MAAIKVLRIEVDGHFHGSSDVPRPWVARITGVDVKYGLAREFVDRLNDWRSARRACSGNLYGVVAAFPLRDGELYEVSRLRGSSSKRHVAREFLTVRDGRIHPLTPAAALAIAEKHTGPAIDHFTADGVAISLVRGLGMPEALGFVLVDGRRMFRLREGSLHEVYDGDRRLVLVQDRSVLPISQADAIRRLSATMPSGDPPTEIPT